MTENKKKKLLIEESSDESSNKNETEISNKKSSVSSQNSSSSFDTDIVNLKKEFETLNCNDDNFFSDNCNKFLLKKELIERNYLSEKEDENPYLYPTLNDTEFNIKIATKKEFNDTKYDGTIYEDIKKQADILAKADFELQPHQAFVKNFLSFQTPYSSLLLYHGLGSGKTCSAIGVTEEMRDYMKQIGATKRIIIVASENVQDNFKLQLFDERKLKEVNGIWSMKGCIGNKLLKEINPMNMPMPKEKVISQIKNLINTYYIFLGYVQFANYIIKTMNYEEEMKKKKEKRVLNKKGEKREKTKIEMLKDVQIDFNSRVIRRLRNEFDNRLVVIDEVHNIRKTDNKKNKKVAVNIEFLVKAAQNMRFLLLSATPMYNSYKEIIWLLNLMNTNDRRGIIDVKDVFDKNGNLKKNGEELLIRKATGYVSFVRGENPYTFPYRVYPNEFAPQNTFPAIKYPSYQMNLKKIKHEDKKRILSLYLTTIGGCNTCGQCQYCCYKYIIHNLRVKQFKITTSKGLVKEMPSFDNMESFGYTLLQTPLEALIISYPVPELKDMLSKLPAESLSEDFTPSFSETNSEEENVDDENNFSRKNISKEVVLSQKNEENNEDNEEEIESASDIQSTDSARLTGRLGLERMMNFLDSKSPPVKGNFEYKATTIKNYGKIFSQEKIGNYSAKIKCILDKIYNPETKTVSDGIILIYSQYIDSGLIPVALALEEMGFTRFGEQGIKPLFKSRPSELVDVKTMEPPKDKKNFKPARYSMITGDKRISPNNDFEVKGLTNDENSDGSRVKVVLISRAGSEGIDFKFIRQVHILDPWYNMNRSEQIIGRAVRNFSHSLLPFEKRNVEIFMYGTILDKNVEESADLYVYRVAEYKAIQIGKVTRMLKETAVDCIINHDQSKFTQEIMSATLKEPIVQELSTGEVLKEFKIGDAPFSPSCDYMATCNYNCRPNADIDESKLNEDTYNESFIVMNSEKILQRIRMLFKESFFYRKDILIKSIRTPKEYPYVQIYSALTQLIEDENEFIVDKYGRNGRLINIGEYYLFQPIELNDKNISIYDRSVPLDFKHNMINFELKQNIVKPVIDKRNIEKVVARDEIVEFTEGKLVMDNMNANYDISIEFMKQTKVPRGDDNWYKYSGLVIKKMSKDFPESKKYLIKFLVAHMIELLLFNEKINLMNYLYSLQSIKQDSLEWYAKDYFEKNTFSTEKFIVFVTCNLNKIVIMILDEKNTWIESTPEDRREIAASKETKNFLAFELSDYNNIVGFIGYEKNNKDLAFKTKDMTSKRDTGARCDQASKNINLTKLTKILGEEKYTTENTKAIKDENGNIIQEAIGNNELCVLEEFILRYFNANKENGKKWFLTPEMAIYHKLYTVNV